MTLNACAEIVKSGDADRFLAAMAAPPAARAVLFPIYAMNVEISRAPWVTAEPMIAEIRLQWWRDALAEIAAGQAPRRHEVVEPLAQVLDAEGARLLEPVIDTRRWEIAREPFVSEAQLLGHLAAGAGGLMWAAARRSVQRMKTPCAALVWRVALRRGWWPSLRSMRQGWNLCRTRQMMRSSGWLRRGWTR